jgi:hypothetical protein
VGPPVKGDYHPLSFGELWYGMIMVWYDTIMLALASIVW